MAARMGLPFTAPMLRHTPAVGPVLRIENSVKALSQVSELPLHSRVCMAQDSSPDR
jgi:hypothetical protein